jgi:hypothetical protein
MKISPLCLVLFVTAALTTQAQTATYLGKGLAQHPFLYAGEWDTRPNHQQTLHVVRDGKVVWSYGIPIRDKAKDEIQELGDAFMLANRNLVLCHQIALGGYPAEERQYADQWRREWVCPRGESEGRNRLGTHPAGHARPQNLQHSGGKPAGEWQHRYLQLVCRWTQRPQGLANSVQVLEVTPDKKVVWVLSSWNGPNDLGPASAIQLLDQPGIAEKGDFQQ